MNEKTCKKIAFTLCSNNYLAQAKTLGDSLLRHNPDYVFVIGLVDETSGSINYKLYQHFEIILVNCIPNVDLEPLWRKYNIIELNTCIKASFIKYLRVLYPEAQCIFYFDPDIKVFASLFQLEAEFETYDILLTPHILSPLPLDTCLPAENTFLNYGIYNLGFIGIKASSIIVSDMLDWWEERILEFGYDRTAEGYFVDQIWANLIPIFFANVKILKSFGCNMAPWNLHERSVLIKTTSGYELADKSQLLFYHFSGYDVFVPNRISRYFQRFPLSQLPLLEQIYKEYYQELMANNIVEISKIPCIYLVKQKKYIQLSGASNCIPLKTPSAFALLHRLCKLLGPLGDFLFRTCRDIVRSIKRIGQADE
jgi:hypothetical protein